MKRSFTTRALHLLLTVAIVHQLFISLIMKIPRHGRPGNTGFELHEYVGIASMGIIVAFWFWTLVRRSEHGIGEILPWFSASRRRALYDDILTHLRAIRRFDLPRADAATPLASAIHGLGLLAASAMAGTGTIIFFLMAPDGSLSGFGKVMFDLHLLLSNLMWAYLIAHASIAVLHQLKGHAVLQRIFGF